ncbi:MAG: ABC transporter permease [Candidatus Thorarchaeota archaeon]|nr:ABC transporter permease [Candidatus Thorarchaeota archaeon]
MSRDKSIGTWKYIGQRALQTVLIWFIIITVNFIIFRVMPGDPRQALLGEGLSPELRVAVIERFGLDRPLLEQYWLYLVNLFQGNLGFSFQHFGEPVTETIFEFRFMNTFLLMGTSLLISIFIGMIVGVIAAARRDSLVDTGSTVTFLVAYALPVFWIGILILYYFGFQWNILPLAGTVTRGYDHANIFEYMFDYLHHMTGPLIVLTLSFIGGFYLIMRDTVLDIFTQDYILAAKAKGLKERTILYGHAMRNAMLPMVSVIAVNIPYLISGAMMTEYVFSWSGLGLLTYNAVLSVDYPVLQGVFLFLATITVIANFVADILYLYLDPRIRY